MGLFRLISQTGQTKLLVWRALEDYGDAELLSSTLKHTLGMRADLQDQFPVWVGEQLPKLLGDS
ncbi:MAG: hypothetical protein ACI9R8_001442 [Candidatus Paceibacteria bacterium]|jgi:hypothetical protein